VKGAALGAVVPVQALVAAAAAAAAAKDSTFGSPAAAAELEVERVLSIGYHGRLTSGAAGAAAKQAFCSTTEAARGVASDSDGRRGRESDGGGGRGGSGRGSVASTSAAFRRLGVSRAPGGGNIGGGGGDGNSVSASGGGGSGDGSCWRVHMVGTDGQLSLRHRMPFKFRDDGSKCV
jgi:hypothetical protein